MKGFNSIDFITPEELILQRKLIFPEVLIYGDKYQSIGSDAKIAYMLLFNQLERAINENWFDEKNNVFFKFNYGEMSDIFNWSLNKTKAILSELQYRRYDRNCFRS